MIQPIDPIKRTWMKEMRKSKDLKMRDMSEIFGISYQHYNDIENGRRNPSIELSVEMSRYFGVPIEKFLAERTRFKRGE